MALAAAPWAWVWAASSGRVHTAPEVPPAPVALVLGAGLTTAGTPTPFLAARLDIAADLYARRKVRVVLVSGDNRTHDYDEPTAMRDYLVGQGVPARKVVLDYAGRDTHDSCQRASRIFGVRQVTVVTQGFHLRRAIALCRAAGIEARGVPDLSVRERFPAVWAAGAGREKLANVKAAADVLSRRDPVLGRAETGVRDALDD